MRRSVRNNTGTKRDFPHLWKLDDIDIEKWLRKRARRGLITLDFLTQGDADGAASSESDREGEAAMAGDSGEQAKETDELDEGREPTFSLVQDAVVDVNGVVISGELVNARVWKGIFRQEELHEMEEEVRKLCINENAVLSERRYPLNRQLGRLGSHKGWMKGRVADVLEQRGIIVPGSPIDTSATVVYMDKGASTGWELNWSDGDGDILVHVQLFTSVTYSLGCGSHSTRYRVSLQRGEVMVLSGSEDDSSPFPICIEGRETADEAIWGVCDPPTAAMVLGRRLGPVEVSRIAHLSTQFQFSIGRFTPTDFQKAILSHIQFLRLRSQHKSGLLVLATALGKTVMCILDLELELKKYTGTADRHLLYDSCPCCKKPTEEALTRAHEAQTPRYDFLVIFLVHTRSIRDHAMAKFRRHFSEAYPNSFEEFVSDRVPSRRCRFLFCLFQSFSNVPESTLSRVTHVIVDECHHLLASTYNAAYNHLRSLSNVVYILGLTATLFHADDPTGQQLMRLFDHNYIDLPWQGAKRLRIFPDVEYVETVPADTLETYNGYRQACTHSDDGSVNITRFVNCLDKSISGSNAKIIENMVRPEKVVATLLEYQTQRVLAGQQERRHILIFAPHIDGANAIAASLVEKGVSVTVAHSKLREAQVTRNLESFVRGDVQVLVNVAIVNEGFDAPHVDCVVLARATESEIVFVQQIGRGLRRDTKNGSRDVAVLDMAMNLRRRWVRLYREDRGEGTGKHGARKNNHAQNAQLESWIKDFWPVDTFLPGLQVHQDP